MKRGLLRGSNWCVLTNNTQKYVLWLRSLLLIFRYFDIVFAKGEAEDRNYEEGRRNRNKSSFFNYSSDELDGKTVDISDYEDEAQSSSSSKKNMVTRIKNGFAPPIY